MWRVSCGVEVAAIGAEARKARLRRLVAFVIEHLSLAQRKVLEQCGDGGIGQAVTRDLQIELADAQRLSQLHAVACHVTLLAARELRRHLGAIVAARQQGRANLLRGARVQGADRGRAQIGLILLLLDAELLEHRLAQRQRQAFDHDLDGGRRPCDQQRSRTTGCAGTRRYIGSACRARRASSRVRAGRRSINTLFPGSHRPWPGFTNP